MKKLLAGLAVLALAAGCGSDNSSNDAGTGGFAQPAGTVPVDFTIDDTANQVFTAGQLEWKGSMSYDATTRKGKLDTTWAGPTWAVLYDDGPWDQGNPPGHEPKGSTSGDHKWGVTVFITPPDAGTTNYEYGAIDRLYENNFGNGWIWTGSNGTFQVAAGQTAGVKATGLVLAKFGTNDFKLSIDTNNLSGATLSDGGVSTWDLSRVAVKSAAWGWSEVTMTNAGGGIYTLVLSDIVGAGKTYPHTGLKNSGEKPEFIFVFGPKGSTSKEYKTASGNASTQGVTAGTRSGTTGNFTTATVSINSSNKNTYITIP